VTPFRKKKTDYSDDYHPQTVCPQHASNFFEPGFLGAWTLNSIFISVAGQARFTATFRFKLENLLLQLAWLFLPIFPFLTSTFYKFLRLPAARNVGSWNKNGNQWFVEGKWFAAQCLSKLDALFVVVGQKETLFLGCLEAQPSC